MKQHSNSSGASIAGTGLGVQRGAYHAGANSGAGHDGAIELIGARWGLIPDDKAPSLTFNARSEEAAGKPTWRQSMRSMRCLMPARNWYEWNEKEPVRSESGERSIERLSVEHS